MLLKLKNKKLSLIAALILAVGLCFALPILVSADGGATVTVGSTAEAVAPGDSVTIPVAITDNPGITTYGFEISYDDTNLTLESLAQTDGDANTTDLCVSGLFTPNITTAGAGKARVTWLHGSADVTETGNLCYLNFTVKASAASGDYTITCALADGAAANFKNYAGENVDVIFNTGTIEVLGEEEPPTPFSGSVVAAPLADQSAEPETDLYDSDSYSVDYADDVVTITATNLKFHTNGLGNEGYWVGVGLEIPAGTAYGDIQFGSAADSLSSAGMSSYDFEDGGKEYMSIYCDASSSEKVRTYYVSFDDAATVYSIAIDFSAVTLYEEPPLWGGEGTQANPYTITTAAGLAALAAYTNEGNTTRGVYWALENDIDLSTVCSESLGSWTPIGNKQISTTDVVSGYSFLGDFNGNGHSIQNLYVISATGYLGLFGAIGGNDNHNGTDSYGTVRNFKLYGYVINTLQSGDVDYVGGVCGILYAGGTISDVINYASVLAPCVYNVGGIAGFAGTSVKIGASETYARYTNDPSGSNTSVLRCGNEAKVIGYNKVGGIVGQNAAQVLYCYNKGWIIPHLSGSGGGTGGIVGRNGNNNTAYEEGTIAYCYNAGKVGDNGYSWTWAAGKSNADDEWIRNSDIKWIGGIAGFNNIKSKVRNCYANEFFTQLDISYPNYKNPIVGHLDTDNTYNEVLNAYCLDTLWYSPTWQSERGIPLTQTQFQAATYGNSDILTLLGPAFTADTTNINNGYPILRWQVGESMPSLDSISIAAPPTKAAYDATEIFDPAGMVVLGTYSDGSKGLILDYTYSTDPLAVGATSIDISYQGKTATQNITVSSLTLTGFAITTNPTNLVYAANETFDPAGMVVTATYNENTATNTAIAYDATGAAGYTYTVDENGLLTVSYTEGSVTLTATLQLTRLTSNAPTASNHVYQLDSTDDMLWFANQVNVLGRTTLNAKLLRSIDLSSVTWTPIGTSAKAYCGQFDGNGYTVTFNNTFTANYAGIFGYIGSTTVESDTFTANIHDLTAAGTITATGRSYVAGIAGYVGAGTLTDCTNQAAVTASGSVGGIAGYVANTSSFINCANEGVITATSSYCGGIAGYASAAAFTNCTNSANIIGAGSTAGIAGYVLGASSITYCTNSGNISGSGTVAGICANLSGTAINIQYCANIGSVTGTGTAVAGIAGTGYGTIDNCYNTAAIQGTYYVGGIVGQNYSAALTNCYNRGAITGTGGTQIYMASGGICGLGGTGSFTDCYNSGVVTATYAGALVGASNNSIFTLTNCYYLTGTAPVPFLERTEGRVVTNNVSDKTEGELKALAATLGASYKTASTGYPLLTWQPNEIVGSPADVSDGTASATINDSTTLNEGADVVFDTTRETPDAVTKAVVTIPEIVADGLGGLNSLEINTNMGTITFDSDALDDIQNNGTGSVTLTLDQTSNQNGVTEFELTLRDAGGADIFADGSTGSATVRLPYTLPAGKSADNVKVYYVAADGTRTEVTCTYADGYVTFTVGHFSTYRIETASSGGSGGDGEGGGSGSGNKIEIPVIDVPEATPSFSDVPANHWAYDYIEYLAEAGVTTGRDGKFYPADNITRADFVTMLARMSGDTLPAYNGTFIDVASTAYYAKAVAWAVNAGITTGTSDNAFSPDKQILRQEIAAMIYRYVAYKKATLDTVNEAAVFSDQAQISAYALDAVKAMQQAGIIGGYDDDSYRPLGYATRAEAAKMLALTDQGIS